ncbi:hypothetical protein EQ718_21555 (plasmid) [Paracoccus versutus]|uniref:Uncharacterized protein n=1 Tax=Paracoccus versutus TaxID=34007 RepID=A0AAQ0HJ80_PARVE|nr:hypothetical protein [Paracoccus versutus]REG46049.1 hypothetical protein ATH84_101769 [Paracoccus versutus]WEJ81428.1 hypothetical protein EQ718_21555 [Paracoccus versutus]
MRVVHQGPNDQLALALERAFGMAERASPNALAAIGTGSNPVVEALLASGSPRPVPRPAQEVTNALIAPGVRPQSQGNAIGQTPALRGLFSARYTQPPPSAAAPNGQAPSLHNTRALVDQPSGRAAQPQAAPQAGPPIEVELPDGTIIEFPAGTSDSVMRDALQREYGHGLTGGASRASYSELMAAMRRADAAGDGAAARRLGELAVQARDREKAQGQSKGGQGKWRDAPIVEPQQQAGPWTDYGGPGSDAMQAARLEQAKRELASRQQGNAPGAGPWTKYQSPVGQNQTFEIQGPDGQIYEVQAPDQQTALDAYRQMTQAQPTSPQIVGGVIMPPAVPASGQWDAQPAQMGAKDFIRHGSDAAADMLAAGAAGVSRGVTGLADLPGMLTGGVGKLASSGLERAGVVSPGVAQGMRNAFDMMPAGSGNLFRGTAAAATGGASEFRGNTTAGKYAGTVGEFVPSAMVMPGAPLSNALRYGVVPGLASEAAGQLAEGLPGEQLARAAAGMLAAPALNAAEYGIRRAISPHGGADQGRLALARVLDDAGVPVSAGQRVGNEALRRKEGMTNAGQALNDTQREALTRAALRTAGTDASRATPEVLADTARRIGSVFDDVARGVDVTPEPATLNALAAANETYKQLAPKSSQAPIIGEVVKRMTGAFRTGQTIPASTVNSWRSSLSKLTTSSDGATRSAAIEALGALDDALASTLTSMGRTDDVARLATAREQWRNFLAIQKAATGAGENAAAGILSPSALRSAVVQQGRASYAQGNRGELGNLARAAEGVIRPLPTSGTAENLRALGIPFAMWSAAGATGGYKLAGPMGGLLGAMAASAVPSAAGAARMSRPVQNWLVNQAVGPGGDALPRNALSPVLAALLGLKED